MKKGISLQRKGILLFCLIFLSISCSNQGKESINQQNKHHEMQEQLTTNKKIITDFFEQVSNGNMDAAFKWVDEEVKWWIPPGLPFSGTKTKAEYLQIVGAIKKGFPAGFELKVSDLIAEGNKVAAEVASKGTHVNGKSYHNKYHFLFEIENGKIIAVKEYMDTLHLYQLLQP